jgi:hypothetical protein
MLAIYYTRWELAVFFCNPHNDTETGRTRDCDNTNLRLFFIRCIAGFIIWNGRTIALVATPVLDILPVLVWTFVRPYCHLFTRDYDAFQGTSFGTGFVGR